MSRVLPTPSWCCLACLEAVRRLEHCQEELRKAREDLKVRAEGTEKAGTAADGAASSVEAMDESDNDCAGKKVVSIRLILI